MSTAPRFETKRIDHLGIVAGICNAIELKETIDRVAGQSERKVSCGQAVQAMVLNVLGFTSRALYLMPQYRENKPVDLLINAELDAADFNDDSLGRSLDQLIVHHQVLNLQPKHLTVLRLLGPLVENDYILGF